MIPKFVVPTPTKRALIVAVGNYPAASGWMRISSVNDVALIKNALMHQGFLPVNIQVLTDSMATKAGITAALKGLALRTQPNDVVVFHFSGHGQQVKDDNHDESDGLDEALVPYDAMMQFDPGKYEGQNHLRDDLLGELLGTIRQRAGRGGEVLAIIDACHSGTGTRGLAKARGTFTLMAPPGFKYASTPSAACAEGCSFGADEGDRSNPATDAPLVCYFGASPSQLNFEAIDPQGHGVGSLSLAFSQALTASSAPTYAGLFDRIKNEMASTAPNQTPQMEGPREGQIFRGRTVKVPTHYRATSWPDDRTVLIDGGSLHGLFTGTEVAFYPPDANITPDAHPLTTGRITYIELGRATVTLAQALAGPKPAAWGIVTKKSFGSTAVLLKLDLPAGPLNDSVKAAAKRQPFIKIVNGPSLDLLLELNPKTNTLTLSSAQDKQLYSAPYLSSEPAAFAQSVVDKATDLSQNKYIRSVVTRAPEVAVELTLVPISVKKEGAYVVADQQFDPASKRNATGGLVYLVNDYMQLKVHNKGTKPAYFTILDTQPDNQINVLIPRPNEESNSYVLQPGETRLLPDSYRIAPPLGEEMIKTIAAETPIDLRSVVANRGTGRGRDIGNPFAELLAKTYRSGGIGSRGAEGPPLKPETVNVHDVVYRIAERPNN